MKKIFLLVLMFLVLPINNANAYSCESFSEAKEGFQCEGFTDGDDFANFRNGGSGHCRKFTKWCDGNGTFTPDDEGCSGGGSDPDPEPYCGDGDVNQYSEECDGGYNCTSNCKYKTYCGDGGRQYPNDYGIYEECDDGNSNDNDTCNTSCKKTYCGDGIKQYPNGNGQYEECDGGSKCYGSCKLDNQNPTGNISYTSGWTKDNRTITINNPQDSKSGIKEIILYESINGGVFSYKTKWTSAGTKTWAKSFTSSDNDKGFKYRVIIKDNVDNSITKTGGEIKFDNKKTTGTISYYNGWTNSSKNITVNSSDNGGSGIDTIKLQESINNSNFNTVETWTSGGTKTWNTNFGSGDNTKNFKYRFISVDKVGNPEIIVSSSYIIKYETNKPIGILNYFNGWTNNTKKEVEIKMSDSDSGMQKIILYEKKDSGSFTRELETIDNNNNNVDETWRENFIDDDNGHIFQYKIYGKDIAGNEKSIIGTNELKFDNQGPTGIIDYFEGWTNDDKVISFDLSDKYNSLKGSGIKEFKLIEIKSKNGNFISETLISNGDISCNKTEENNIFNCSYTKHFVYSDNSYTFQYKIIELKDYLGNIGTEIIGGKLSFDNIEPNAIDLTSSPENKSFLVAKDNQNFIIECSIADGSPITKVEGKFENIDDENIFNPIKESTIDNDSSTKNKLEITEDISKIDNFKENENYRKYSQQITKVCDEAGNCSSVTPLKTFNYYVYAGYIDTTKSSVNTGSLTNGDAYADGEDNSLEIILKDEFGNAISPVKDFNGDSSIRNLKINLRNVNKLHLNQFNKTGDSVYVKFDGDSSFDNKISLSETESDFIKTVKFVNKSNGKYVYKFRLYTPTFKSGVTDGREYIDSDEIFQINNIIGIIEENGIQHIKSIINNSIKFAFKPIYNVSFSGDIKRFGLKFDYIQKSQINYIHGTDIYGSLPKIFLHFLVKKVEMLNSLELYFEEGNLDYSESVEKLVSTGSVLKNDSSFSLKPLNNSKYEILTYLKTLDTVDEILKTRFSTYINYGLDGKNIVYPGDFIGVKINQITKQAGVKIIGYIANSIKEIISGTKGRDLNTLGKLTKMDFKTSIEKNIFGMLKSIKNINNGTKKITTFNFVETTQDGAKTNNNNILYFNGDDGDVIVLGDGSDLKVFGKKTIVIKGADLYIKNNIYYENKNIDSLGIIVLSDEEGVGGNVYIDPEVTNIVGAFYLSKTIKTGIMDSGILKEIINKNNLELLKNQLHIFGNIFSENTIGGSIGANKKCPYYINNCTKKEAQKYDLNFLRRFSLIHKETKDDGTSLYVPAYDGKVIGNGVCKYEDIDGDEKEDDGEVECNGDSKFARSITNTNDKYASQAVIIEYNPNFLNNIPPMFEK